MSSKGRPASLVALVLVSLVLASGCVLGVDPAEEEQEQALTGPGSGTGTGTGYPYPYPTYPDAGAPKLDVWVPKLDAPKPGGDAGKDVWVPKLDQGAEKDLAVEKDLTPPLPPPYCPLMLSTQACTPQGKPRDLAAVSTDCAALVASKGLSSATFNASCMQVCLDNTMAAAAGCVPPVVMPPPIEACWATGGAPNHCDPASDMRYDIWQANCHTAANAGVLADPTHTGIVVCGGQPEITWNPGDHTYNYKIDPAANATTYWNWGESCGPCPGAPPKTFNARNMSCHTACVKKFCGDQFSRDTRTKPVGQMVEIPGPSVCASEISKKHGGAFDASYQSACLGCCDRRADTWPNIPRYCQRNTDREDFRKACKYLCQGFFSAPPPTCPYQPSVQACTAQGAQSPGQIWLQCQSVVAGYKLSGTATQACLTDCMNRTNANSLLCTTTTTK